MGYSNPILQNKTARKQFITKSNNNFEQKLKSPKYKDSLNTEHTLRIPDQQYNYITKYKQNVTVYMCKQDRHQTLDSPIPNVVWTPYTRSTKYYCFPYATLDRTTYKHNTNTNPSTPSKQLPPNSKLRTRQTSYKNYWHEVILVRQSTGQIYQSETE